MGRRLLAHVSLLNCLRVWPSVNLLPVPFFSRVGTTHSIGGLWFGSDGKLWASVGEGQLLEGSYWRDNWGALAGYNRALSMDVNFLGGKILRMETNTTDGVLLGIRDNPFHAGNVRQARSMVWAVGLRNPWRCTHNPPNRATEVICGVVGFYTYESVVRIRRGDNLGWPCWEGLALTPGGGSDTPVCLNIRNNGAPSVGYPAVKLQNVLHVYNHNGLGAAAIGGVILPSYFPGGTAGQFIFGDYPRSTLSVMNTRNGFVRSFGQNADGVTSFRISPFDGKVYMVAMCNGCGSRSEIRRFEVRGYQGPPRKTTRRPTTTKRLTGTAALCRPTNGPNLLPLPQEPDGQPWQTMMLLGKSGFPSSRIQFWQNGQWGSVGLDSSVGPGPNRSSEARVISIGRELFTSGYGTKGPSFIHIMFGGLNRCWKFVARVGIDDEINIGGMKPAWGDFVVRSGPSNILYQMNTPPSSLPITSGEAARTIEITGLDKYPMIQLLASRPQPAASYPFNTSDAHYDWASARLYCGPDAPYLPIVKIDSPTGVVEYSIGDTVPFSGSAKFYTGLVDITDPASFSWTVVLVHCQGYLCHQHQEVGSLSGRSGSFLVSDHSAGTTEQYYFYEIQLTVRDGCGRSDTARQTVKVKGFSGEVV